METKTVDTERSILKAAEKLFLKRGYDKTSTAEIAKAAKCNSAMIHYYFRTKEKLFMTILREKFKLLIDSFLNIRLENMTFEQKLMTVTETHFEFIRKNERFPFMLISELSTNPSTVKILKQDVQDIAKDVLAIIQIAIDDEAASGRIRRIEVFDLMLNIISMNVVTFIALPILLQVGNIEREEYLESRKKEIVHTIINSMKV